MITVPGLSDAVNSDQPVMHVSSLDDSARPVTGPEPTTDAAVVNDPGPGHIEVI
jgi:hypothetical protein